MNFTTFPNSCRLEKQTVKITEPNEHIKKSTISLKDKRSEQSVQDICVSTFIPSLPLKLQNGKDKNVHEVETFHKGSQQCETKDFSSGNKSRGKLPIKPSQKNDLKSSENFSKKSSVKQEKEQRREILKDRDEAKNVNLTKEDEKLLIQQ